MKKKIVLLAGILVAVVSLVGCDFKLPFSNPFASTKDKLTDATDDFFKYAKDSKVDEMKKMVDDPDCLKDYRPSEEESDEKGDITEEQMVKLFVNYQDECAKKMTYEIKDVDEEKKTVTCKCKYIDSKEFVQRFMKESINAVVSSSMNNSKDDKADEKIKKAFDEAYEKATKDLGDSFIESDITIEFVEKDKEFKIKEISNEFGKVLTANMSDALEKVYGSDSSDDTATDNKDSKDSKEKKDTKSNNKKDNKKK